MNRACAVARWHTGCINHPRAEEHADFASTPQRATKLTEDPPFGGLWCDQPAIFLSVESATLEIQVLLP